MVLQAKGGTGKSPSINSVAAIVVQQVVAVAS